MAMATGRRWGPRASCQQLTPGASMRGRGEADANYALAETALRTGLTVITVVAATNCLFAVLAGGGVTAAVQGVLLTSLAIFGVVRTDVAARILCPRGRVVLLAMVFGVAGLIDADLQRYFGEVAAAIALVAALVCGPRWVLLCVVISAAGFLGSLALHGSALAWMLGDGRYIVAGQLVNLAANATAGLLMIALLRRFLADAQPLLAAVRGGGRSLTPQLALAAGGRDMRRLPPADVRALIATLTPAECDVLGLLAAGRAPKQAAGDLSIALATVRSRIALAKRKTGARTIEHLVSLYAGADVA